MDSVVRPLRIGKNASSPNKMAASRPLAEIGSFERRRNSPSYNEATKKMIVSRESSPYTENSFPKASPRDFWSTRDDMSPSRFDENTPECSPSPSLASPKRRTSIELLKQSGRVKNSNIFALETRDAYDPATLPIVERPSANRPLSQQLANNTFTRFDSLRKENAPLRSPQRPGHKRSETEINIPLLTQSRSPAAIPLPASPTKDSSPSPTKSSLSRNSQFGVSTQSLDLDNGIQSAGEERAPTPRTLHHHAKSVTFHAENPKVHEYEQQTPEPSVSAASDREGSWESDEFYDQDVSFDRGGSTDPHERRDSSDADLENTNKTPVVMPGDWRRMSPVEARTDLVDAGDDVFDPSAGPATPGDVARSSSTTSDGDARPLPPLPAFMTQKARRDSAALSAIAERASLAARNLPSPPKRASCSKDDILRMTRESSLTMQDRLELMTHPHERPSSKSSQDTIHGDAEEMTITNLDTGAKMDVLVRVTERPVEEDSTTGLREFVAPPKISRESILRKVRGTKYDHDEVDEDDVEESAYLGGDGQVDYAELARMDPDQPIPSRETSRDTSDNYNGRESPPYAIENQEFKIKDEPTDDDGLHLADIPAIDESHVQSPRSPSHADERQTSVLRHGVRVATLADDDQSHYSSSLEPEAESTLLDVEQAAPEIDGKESLQDAMQLLTVKDYTQSAPAKNGGRDFMGLQTYLGTDDYDFGLARYITPSPPPSRENTRKLDITSVPSLQPSADFKHPLQAPTLSYVERDVSPPGTPESVIHRSSDVSSMHSHDTQPDLVVIPERHATIKTGGKLKARPSATPQDFEIMAEQRRIVSSGHPVPPIPDHYRAEAALAEGRTADSESGIPASDSIAEPKPKGRRKSGRVNLDLTIPDLENGVGEAGLGLDAEFNRVIEGQKVGHLFPAPLFTRPDASTMLSQTVAHPTFIPFSPHPCSNDDGANPYPRPQQGYLLRQNTKVVVASNRNVSNESNGTVDSCSSNELPMSPTSEFAPRSTSRGTRSANSSPRKPSAEQYLKTEPWNGKVRRKSVRNASAQKTTGRSQPAPPLPGQESVLDVVDENYAAGFGTLEDEVAEGVERGRLFVKVVGVKDLALPLPTNDRIYFQLTLDNGLHCVTTSSLELGTHASIGQEFELVVLNDLEFQLTLTTKLPAPPAKAPTPTPSSPTKSIKSQKTSAFARFLSSPKKRAEKERQDREAAEAEERRHQDEARRQRALVQPTTWDLLHELVNASDGAFARAYINLKSHEHACFGRHLTVDVPCYNEWALENDAHVVSSVRSKRGAHAGPIRRPPYVVGQLELQLLYVPKPNGATDEDLPKSMGGAVREMNKAGEVKEVVFEGHLSQQGGDCTHWRRRFFRLQGPQLTAYHEHTQQKRAVINLTKASRLVDDKTTLVANPASANPGAKNRRKSAFAEEDEGYAYVEEGFRIRFANGETIDFYADGPADKDRWMKALTQVVGKADVGAKAARWTDIVLARERSQGRTLGIASSSPTKQAGTDMQDFAKPAPSHLHPSSSPMRRRESDRKPVAPQPREGSKSAPTSPMKRAQPLPRTAPAVPGPARPTTPQMSPRKGHRSRDAVKSMLF